MPVTDRAIAVSASIGCFLVPPNAQAGEAGVDEAARVADIGMYQAKAEGRGRAVWVRLTDAGSAAWPWRFTVAAGTLRNWLADGWAEVRSILPGAPP